MSSLEQKSESTSRLINHHVLKSWLCLRAWEDEIAWRGERSKIYCLFLRWNVCTHFLTVSYKLFGNSQSVFILLPLISLEGIRFPRNTFNIKSGRGWKAWNLLLWDFNSMPAFTQFHVELFEDYFALTDELTRGILGCGMLYVL